MLIISLFVIDGITMKEEELSSAMTTSTTMTSTAKGQLNIRKIDFYDFIINLVFNNKCRNKSKLPISVTCDRLSCSGNGQCVKDAVDGFNCTCDPGYDGKVCENSTYRT